MENQPLNLGIKACEALMHKYKPEALPPVGTLFYHQGVFLSGMQNIYYLTGEKRFFDYIPFRSEKQVNSRTSNDKIHRTFLLALRIFSIFSWRRNWFAIILQILPVRIIQWIFP